MVNYFCHICRQGFVQENQNEDIKCTHCGSEFVEEVQYMPQEFTPQIPQIVQANPQPQNVQQNTSLNQQPSSNNEQRQNPSQNSNQSSSRRPLQSQATAISFDGNGQIRVEVRRFNSPQEMGNLFQPIIMPFDENYLSNIAQIISMQDMGRIGPPKTADFVIQTLEETKINTNDECPICKENITQEEIVKKLPCEHFFHSQCVVTWLTKHNTCPVCRESLASEEELL